MSNPNLNTSIRMDAADHALGAALTITTLLKEVSSLIPHAGPLANVLRVAKELITIVNQMHDNKDHAIEEIKKDAGVWKNTLNRFWSQDKIKAAIVKHEKNLSDCFLTFMVGTGIQLGATSDNSTGKRKLAVRPDSNLVSHSE
ncbi:hypothetical protein C0991_001443 [Blastosporella zonata]|nr:hypothetical protein C0991_001443 [Blastosporella zonata]